MAGRGISGRMRSHAATGTLHAIHRVEWWTRGGEGKATPQPGPPDRRVPAGSAQGKGAGSFNHGFIQRPRVSPGMQEGGPHSRFGGQ